MVISFVAENAAVIESKISEPRIFKKKKELWVNLSHKMRQAGYIRSPSKLKDNYHRMKQAAKAKISVFKKTIKKTGGGSPPVAPSETDWALHSICPNDFTEDTSKFDSDYIKVSIT